MRSSCPSLQNTQYTDGLVLVVKLTELMQCHMSVERALAPRCTELFLVVIQSTERRLYIKMGRRKGHALVTQ